MAKNPFYDEYRINTIKNLITTKKYEKVDKLIDEYKELFPKDRMIVVYEAKLLTSKRRYHDSEIVLKSLLEEDLYSDYVRYSATLELADVLRFQYKTDEAIKYYKICMKEPNSTSIYAVIKIINIYAEKRDYTKALDIIKNVPKEIYEPKIDLRKASIYIEQNNYNNALDILSKINDNDLYTIDYQNKYFLMSKIYYLTNDSELAIYYINNCFKEKNKYYYKAYVLLARIKCKLDKDEEAISMCNEVLRLYPIPDAKELLIRIYLKLGLLDDAHNMTDSLWLEQKDDNQKYYYNGKIELAKGNYELAEMNFEKVLNASVVRHHKCEIEYLLMVTKYRLNKFEDVKKIANKFECTIQGNDLRKHIRKDVSLMDYLINNKKNTDNLYSINQIRNYSRDEAINHILTKHFNMHDFNSKIIKNEEDFIKLFNIIENSLNIKNKLVRGFFDSYIIRYDKIGYHTDSTDFIEVICVPNTYNIITMYPSGKYREIHDKMIEIDKSKTKKLSQVDKFYKRYGKLS